MMLVGELIDVANKLNEATKNIRQDVKDAINQGKIIVSQISSTIKDVKSKVEKHAADKRAAEEEAAKAAKDKRKAEKKGWKQ